MNVRVLALLAALALTAPLARAQDGPPIDAAAEREAQYAQAFAEGLAAITRRDLATSEALFKGCIQLFPDRPIAYYNLACTFSLAERVEEAVAALRACFDRGYVDLAHMGRDLDLDPIRRAPAFRAAMSEFEAALLAQVGPALTHAPASGPVEGLLVWIHAPGAQPARDLERLRAALPAWAILVPQGVPVRGAFAWDSRIEFVVLERLRAFASELGERGGEAPRAIVVGEGVIGPLALNVAVQHPDRVLGALAAGANLGSVVDGDLIPTGTRAYLVVQRDDAAQVESGVLARDRFVEAGSPVVLERHGQPSPLTQDPALLLRGVGWLSGKQVSLPGAGSERTF